MKKAVKVSRMADKEWRRVRHKHVNSPGAYNFKARTKNLITVKKVLDQVELKFWLTNGTALAAYREKDWIKWDDDADLDVYEENLFPKYNKLKEKFISLGFIVRGKHIKQGCKMSLFRDGEKIALRGLYLDPSYKNNTYRLRKHYKYSRKFYETPGTIQFKGHIFNIPSLIEDFLVYIYGKKWHIPLKSDNESEYSTKRIKR